MGVVLRPWNILAFLSNSHRPSSRIKAIAPTKTSTWDIIPDAIPIEGFADDMAAESTSENVDKSLIKYLPLWQ